MKSPLNRSARLLLPLALALSGADECLVPSPSNHQIAWGQGYSDVSPHQIVRTTANIIYTVAPTCADYPDCPNNVIRVHKGNQAGTPTAYTELDAAHAPGGGVGSVAVAIDGQDKIHVLWHKRSGTMRYAVFDTATSAWGTAESLGSTGWTDFGQGEEGVGIALDSSGIPHAVWNTRTGINNRLRIQYARRPSTGWTTPVEVSDVVDCNPASDYCNAWHPTLAFTPGGDLLLAWLNGTYDYVPDGRVRVRKRTAAGTWQSSVAISSSAQSGIDQGPSMIVTTDGVAHLTFLDTSNRIRYWYDDGTGWKGDLQPSTQVTHNPSLGTDLTGAIFIYGHGTPVGPISGHGNNLYYFTRARGGLWSAWTLYASGSIDSSVSTRWSQFFHHHPENRDTLYWGDSYPNYLYVGVN